MSKFIISIFFNFFLMLGNAQNNEVFIEINVKKDYESELKILFEKDTIENLRIAIPENSGGYDVYSRINYSINYENPSIHLKYKVPNLPNEIGNLTSLRKLNISSLGLDKLPDSLIHLKNLEVLDISRNNISLIKELPKLKELSSLKLIKAYGCPISEAVVESIDSLNLEKGLRYTIEHAELEEEDMLPASFDSVPKILKAAISQYYTSEGEPILSALNAKLLLRNDPNSSLRLEWDEFKSDLNKKLHEYQTVSLGESQFPSFSILIFVSDKTENNIRVRKTLQIDLSLLTNHYALYFESLFWFNDYEIMNRPLTKTIYFGKENASEPEKKLFQSVKKLIKKHFPEHNFVDHKTLFTSKMPGKPFKQAIDSTQSYAIYNFLFGLNNVSEKDIVE